MSSSQFAVQISLIRKVTQRNLERLVSLAPKLNSSHLHPVSVLS